MGNLEHPMNLVLLFLRTTTAAPVRKNGEYPTHGALFLPQGDTKGRE